MHQLHLHAHLRAYDEKLLEMKNLTIVGDIYDLGGIIILDAALYTRHIGCGVVEPAVRLPHDCERKPLFLKAHDERTIRLLGQAHLNT